MDDEEFFLETDKVGIDDYDGNPVPITSEDGDVQELENYDHNHDYYEDYDEDFDDFDEEEEPSTIQY